MKKIVTAHNYVRPEGFRFAKPSLTVPGQTSSVKDVLARFQRGQSVKTYQGVYNPDFPPEYDTLTIQERMDLARENRAKLDSMRKALSRKQERSEEKADAPDTEPSRQQSETKP